jgi:hypothetical protein
MYKMQPPPIAAKYDGKQRVYYYTTNFDFKLLPFNITTPVSIHHCPILPRSGLIRDHESKSSWFQNSWIKQLNQFGFSSPATGLPRTNSEVSESAEVSAQTLPYLR